MLEEFENESLTKIVPLPLDKVESKSTLDLPTCKPPRTNAKKWRKKLWLEGCSRARGVNDGLVSFCYLLQGTLACSMTHGVKILRCSISIFLMLMCYCDFSSIGTKLFLCKTELNYRVRWRLFASYYQIHRIHTVILITASIFQYGGSYCTIHCTTDV